MKKLLPLLLLLIATLHGDQVEVMKIVDGSTLYIKEYIKTETELEKTIALNISNDLFKHGAIRLAGVKVEPYNDQLYTKEEVSKLGQQAYIYMKTRLSGGVWNLEVDKRGITDENGLPLVYLVSENGSNLNVELVEKGYSPYYFKNGFAHKYHISFVGAERTAFHEARGVWDKTTEEGQERRAYYYKERRKWAKNLGKAPPSLAMHGKRIDYVGEQVTKKDLLIGLGVIIFLFLFQNHRRIVKRHADESYYKKNLKWKFMRIIPFVGSYTKSVEEYLLEKNKALVPEEEKEEGQKPEEEVKIPELKFEPKQNITKA